ncbi:MAG: hypothetical protein GF405_10765 [Candidatus Eisenbacteria bacterium]|nr:hypothetical protein [Candidatus Eisenbacteria bacterium]
MSGGPALVVLANDLPDSSYGAERLAEAFEPLFDTRIVDPTQGLSKTASRFDAEPHALVLAGSDRSVSDELPWMLEEQELVRHAALCGMPVLGICFGHQLIAVAFGASLLKRSKRVGIHDIRVAVDDPVLGSTGSVFRAPEQNAEHVAAAPEGFECVAASDTCAVEAIRSRSCPIYGFQFHPCYGDDVLEIDEAWQGFERSRFRHDGAEVLARTAAFFSEVCGGRARGSCR